MITPKEIRVDGIKVWNTKQGGSLQVAFLMKNLLNPGQNPNDLEGIDYGTASSLAGVGVDIPATLSQDITGESGTTNLVSAATGSGSTDLVLFELVCRCTI
jgi:hypothetical protein